MLENINRFLESLRTQNSSGETIKNYRYDLLKFNEWCNCEEIKNIEVETLLDYSNSLCDYKPTTISRKLASLKSFYGFLYKYKLIETNIALNLEMPKIDKKQPHILEDFEIYSILESCLECEHKNSARDYLLLQLVLCTGIRRKEVSNIKLKDISTENNRILIHGKGGKERYVYFNNKVANVLNEYIVSARNTYKNAKTSEYLFLSLKSDKLAVNSINVLFNKYTSLAGVEMPDEGLHLLRKKFANTAYNNTHDIYAVSSALGHASVETTRIYTNVGQERLKELSETVCF